MLVLARQRDESINIGDHIVVTVVDIRGDKVRLGVTAPRAVPVHRAEVFNHIKAGKGVNFKKLDRILHFSATIAGQIVHWCMTLDEYGLNAAGKVEKADIQIKYHDRVLWDTITLGHQLPRHSALRAECISIESHGG